jgi:hypothetical protein
LIVDGELFPSCISGDATQDVHTRASSQATQLHRMMTKRTFPSLHLQSGDRMSGADGSAVGLQAFNDDNVEYDPCIEEYISGTLRTPNQLVIACMSPRTATVVLTPLFPVLIIGMSIDYLNTEEVRNALHVNVDNRPVHVVWTECNYTIFDKWPTRDIYGSVYDDYQKLILMNAGLQILIYSGDNDLICPTVGTQFWLFNKMPLQVRMPTVVILLMCIVLI